MMIARPLSIVVALVSISACNAAAQPNYADPAACFAAYSYVVDAATGTPLARHPQNEALKARAVFELTRLEKGEGLTAGKRRADLIRKELEQNTTEAYKLAAHCTAEEDITGGYQSSHDEVWDGKIHEIEALG
jgi:hypothetical protein